MNTEDLGEEYRMQNEQLKNDLKKFESMYQSGSPLITVLQQARLAISDLEDEVQFYKRHAEDYEELYKQRNREKNELKRQLDEMNTA